MSVSAERWQDAQAAEQSYWNGLLSDDREFLRILLEKGGTAVWASESLGPLPDGDAVEIGIGPLGVGCVHFVPGPRARVGVEPLPLVDPGVLGLVEPWAGVVRACRSLDYTHVRATGEESGLEPGRFALAFCYNVLDHVRDPFAVLREINRILQPGGRLVLGVDTRSALGVLRFKLRVERRYADSILVRAHPFHFSERAVRELVERAGFRVVAGNGRRPRAFYDLAGHAHRLLLACEKQ